MAHFGQCHLQFSRGGGQLGEGMTVAVVQQPPVLSGPDMALNGKAGGNDKGRRQKADSQHPDLLF